MYHNKTKCIYLEANTDIKSYGYESWVLLSRSKYKREK